MQNPKDQLVNNKPYNHIIYKIIDLIFRKKHSLGNEEIDYYVLFIILVSIKNYL